MTLVTFEIMAPKLLLEIHCTELLCFYLEFWNLVTYSHLWIFSCLTHYVFSQSRYLFYPYNFVAKGFKD